MNTRLRNAWKEFKLNYPSWDYALGYDIDLGICKLEPEAVDLLVKYYSKFPSHWEPIQDNDKFYLLPSGLFRIRENQDINECLLFQTNKLEPEEYIRDFYRLLHKYIYRTCKFNIRKGLIKLLDLSAYDYSIEPVDTKFVELTVKIKEVVV